MMEEGKHSHGTETAHDHEQCPQRRTGDQDELLLALGLRRVAFGGGVFLAGLFLAPAHHPDPRSLLRGRLPEHR